ncbi:MAG TPA: sulfotransferase domain-containing protein [Gammaproteobacteria bacterium]|nr:sulfotransferase domain-containing protein [Gammaproteobacteria bacterium]
MTKRRVLVVGYPKSGNTWLTRLTAELLGSPVKGFWKEPRNNDVAIEGHGRESDIEVFKGHHSYGAMRRDFSLADVVYVVRDVRDVAISGARFFSFKPPSWLGKVTHSTRRLLPAVRREWLESVRTCRMILTLADGNRDVSPWCAQAWDEHIYAYLDAGACVIRYEDLLASPERECRKLLAHFGVERSAAQIRHAIANQSFKAAKQRFVEQGDERRAAFLREGRAGAWWHELSAAQQQFCRERFGEMLGRLGYPTGADVPVAVATSRLAASAAD